MLKTRPTLGAQAALAPGMPRFASPNLSVNLGLRLQALNMLTIAAVLSLALVPGVHRRPLLARVTLAPRAAVSLLTDDEMKTVFKSFDKDGDGMINTVELRTMMTQLGQRPTEAQLRDVLGAADVDGSGTIDFLEFRSVLQRQAKAETAAAALQHGQRAPLAVPQLSSCASSGRARRLLREAEPLGD